MFTLIISDDEPLLAIIAASTVNAECWKLGSFSLNAT
jgi:hypothetical protein